MTGLIDNLTGQVIDEQKDVECEALYEYLTNRKLKKYDACFVLAQVLADICASLPPRHSNGLLSAIRQEIKARRVALDMPDGMVSSTLQ